MAGDFNDWPRGDVSDFASLLGLRDAAVAINGRMARTFRRAFQFLRLIAFTSGD